MAILCPKGHESSEPDFCSECGAKIKSGTAAVLGSGAPNQRSGPMCPDCGAFYVPGAGNFCEVCGYNFVTGAHGEIPFMAPPAPAPPAPPPPPTPPPAPIPEPVTVPEKPITGWTLVVAVDASLREEGSPPAPIDSAPLELTIGKPVNLIGRTSQTRAIHPEIPLDDDGAVSHRHAVITRGDDGMISLRDIGSTNGTRLNGHDVTAMTDIPLQDGDELTLGHWTRITIRAVR